MFFLANGKYFLTRFFLGGRGNLAVLSVLKTAEIKYLIFFIRIVFLHNQETICLEKKHSPPLNGLCLSNYISERFQIWHHVLYC